MSQQLGPLDIECDSPPFSIVEACERAGFRSPADVGWCRLVPMADKATGRRLELRHFRVLGWLFRARRFSTKCVCGRRLPALGEYVFTSTFGERTAYILGQCPACRTMLWAPATDTCKPGAK
jgi:hypothetical protein